MKRTLMVAVAALALVATACGGDGDSNGSLSGAAVPGGVNVTTSTTLAIQTGAPGYLPGRYELSLTQGFTPSVRGNGFIGYIETASDTSAMTPDLSVSVPDGVTKVIGVINSFSWGQKKGDVMTIAMRVSSANLSRFRAASSVKISVHLFMKDATGKYIKTFRPNTAPTTGTVKFMNKYTDPAPTGVPTDTIQSTLQIAPTTTASPIVAFDGTTQKSLSFVA